MCGATTPIEVFPRGGGRVSVMKRCERHQAVEDLFKVVSLGAAMADLQLITERVLLS